MMSATDRFETPDDAVRALAGRLATVSHETSDGAFAQRVLAGGISADGDSPAADVSAMDGYAVRMTDLERDGEIRVAGESAPGAPPPELPPGSVVRIFTGAVVPAGGEAVVKREETIESGATIRWRGEARSVAPGSNIRRAGENTRRGDRVMDAGQPLTPPRHAAAAAFGVVSPDVYRRVRVCLVTTGDEVLDPHVTPEPWQLRNSNRAAIASMLCRHGWIAAGVHRHVRDDRDELAEAFRQALATSDAVILTGGVSMGDRDHVPEICERLGAETVFHRLPIRPGKPILGAATDAGKLILGLPGNPVSATLTCYRFALPLLAKMAGRVDWMPHRPVVTLATPGVKTLPLWWMRPVRLVAHGLAEPIASKGSGDLVALTQSDGFVELPPGATGEGPWPYFAW